MSWFKLKRLLSHRKVWKLLTNKLPLKLSRSKANKKPKSRSFKTCKKLGWPSLSIQPKKFKKKPNSHALVQHKNHHRSPLPVYVDQLFMEPLSAVRAHVPPPQGQASKQKLCSLGRPEFLDQKSRSETGEEEGSVNDDHNMVSADDVWESMVLASPQMHAPPPQGQASKQKLCSLGRPEFLDQKSRSETGKEEGSVNDDHNMVSADDVWESMVLASPQMHGINERAEEFIARFRADMRYQEIMARRL